MTYRDDYYDKSSREPGVTELIVTKQRNGPTGTFKVGFEASCTQFYNLAEGAYCE
jgi:replicative DNA helicase